MHFWHIAHMNDTNTTAAEILTPIERVAIAAAMGKATELKDIKDNIPQGWTEKGAVDIHVDFELERGFNTTIAPTATILSTGVIARAAVLMGAMAPNFFEALRQAAEDAYINNTPVGQEILDADQRVFDMLEEVKKQVIAKMPRTPRSGATTVRATICRSTCGKVTTTE